MTFVYYATMSDENKPQGKENILSFRCNDKTERRLDMYLEKLREQHPALSWSRSTAVLALVIEGLDRHLGKEKSK